MGASIFRGPHVSPLQCSFTPFNGDTSVSEFLNGAIAITIVTLCCSVVPISMTRCKIISVNGNVIEIESIDAFPNTPVLDIKS